MKIKFTLLLAAATLLFGGCDKIKEATTKDFNVNGISLAFLGSVTAPDTDQQSDGLSAGDATPNEFEIVREVNISEISSSDLTQYLDHIEKVVTKSASLTISTLPAETYTVTNVTISCGGLPGSIMVSSYTTGDTLIATSAMKTYLSSFISKLLTNSVTVTVTGKTDAPLGTPITVTCQMDVTFTASLL